MCDDQGDPGTLPPLRERSDRLGLRVPLHADEPMAGYLARFAARAGHPTIKACLRKACRANSPCVTSSMVGARKTSAPCSICRRARSTPPPRGAPSAGAGISAVNSSAARLRLLRRRARLSALSGRRRGLRRPDGAAAGRAARAHVLADALVAACPTHGVRLIEVAGGLERFAHLARSDRRPAWDAIPTQPASEAETKLARLVAGHLGFVAPLALPKRPHGCAAAGLPAIVDLAALIGFGLTGEPAEQAPDEVWRRWIGLGLSRLLAMPLVDLVQGIAARLPQLRSRQGRPRRPSYPASLTSSR